jgi:hypothetical protein
MDNKYFLPFMLIVGNQNKGDGTKGCGCMFMIFILFLLALSICSSLAH